eukprot:Hpha_TRINITY_DN14538_c0_g1::TRINITY_DN14538_c0_g1_i1::g.47085::m.47085
MPVHDSIEYDLADAASNGRYDDIVRLIRRGAVVDNTESGCTPLMWAAKMGRVDIAALLIEHGADPSKDGPVECAASMGRLEVTKLLVEKGGDPSKGLEWAARYGHLEVAKMLVAVGADLNRTNRQGATPLEWAQRYDQAPVAQFLEEAAQAQLNESDADAAEQAQPPSPVRTGPGRWECPLHGSACGPFFDRGVLESHVNSFLDAGGAPSTNVPRRGSRSGARVGTFAATTRADRQTPIPPAPPLARAPQGRAQISSPATPPSVAVGSPAAALRPRTPQTARVPAPAQPPASGQISSVTGTPGRRGSVLKCVICFSKPSSCVVIPCGHLCLCDDCKPMLEGQPCPICRAESSGIYRVYM